MTAPSASAAMAVAMKAAATTLVRLASSELIGRLQRDQRTHPNGREDGEQACHGAPFPGRGAYPAALR